MSKVIIGVDLGGTQIRAARLDQTLAIQERHKTLTLADEGRNATIERIKKLIKLVLPDDGSTVAGIGVSAPGPLNPDTGVVVAPPNLPGWHDVPLGDILHEEFGVPVYVGNDANVAALAEAARGAAQGFRHIIYLTLSTGIGSGIIYDGRLLLGKSGLAAEAGHIPIIVEGNHVSTLELEAAGPALARQCRAKIEAGAASSVMTAVNGDLDRIDARIVGEAANNGDEVARSVVLRGARIVGLGIVSLLHLFNPEIIVIGGGVSNIGALLFDNINATIKQHALDDDYWKDLIIAHADLADDVSIIGAAALVVTEGGHADVTQVLQQLNQRDER